MCLFLISDCVGVNNSKRYRMAYCGVEKTITAKKKFFVVKFSLTSVSRILGLAWFMLRKWTHMLPKTKIMLSVSHFLLKTTCLLHNIIIHAKMIYFNTKIKKKIWRNPSWNVLQFKIKLVSWNFWQSKRKKFLPTAWNFSHHEIENKDII